MRLATTDPWTDPWMVRVSWSAPLGGADGERPRVERFTAVNLDPKDETPGVHPMTHEAGFLARDAATGAWLTHRRRIEAQDGSDAHALAAAVYDAAEGFLALGLAPTGGDAAVQVPGRFTLEIGDHAWSFPIDAVPTEAWHVLRTAQSMLA